VNNEVGERKSGQSAPPVILQVKEVVEGHLGGSVKRLTLDFS